MGDKDLVITGLSGIQEAKEGDLTFLANSKYIPLSNKTKATAIITSRDIEITGKSVIRTDNPSLAFADRNIFPYNAIISYKSCLMNTLEGMNIISGRG